MCRGSIIKAPRLFLRSGKKSSGGRRLLLRACRDILESQISTLVELKAAKLRMIDGGVSKISQEQGLHCCWEISGKVYNFSKKSASVREY